MDRLLEELRRRWSAMYTALAQGEDVPPGTALRTEGMMEAALLLAPATSEQLDAALSLCYEQATGRTFIGDLGEDWRDNYPFPQIPLWMQRAPVVPTTAD